LDFTVDKIFPFVRYVHYIELVPAFTTHLQVANDHRIFYCVKGDYQISVDDTVYVMEESSLLFVPAGTPYHLHPPKKNVLLIGINFDFTQEHCDLTIPIAPTTDLNSSVKENLLEDIHFTDVADFNNAFVIYKQHSLFSLIQQMLDEYTTKRLFYNQKNSSILKQMLTSIARTMATNFSHAPKSTVDIVINYIQENYKRHISNVDIGRELNFHPNYLNRIMLIHTGKSLHKYLLNLRLTKALDLLQTTPMTVTEIAEEVGFSDVQQFCKFFQAQTGSTPGSFR